MMNVTQRGRLSAPFLYLLIDTLFLPFSGIVVASLRWRGGLKHDNNDLPYAIYVYIVTTNTR